jgi:hypothetical protein
MSISRTLFLEILLRGARKEGTIASKILPICSAKPTFNVVLSSGQKLILKLCASTFYRLSLSRISQARFFYSTAFTQGFGE